MKYKRKAKGVVQIEYCGILLLLLNKSHCEKENTHTKDDNDDDDYRIASSTEYNSVAKTIEKTV